MIANRIFLYKVFAQMSFGMMRYDNNAIKQA